MLEEKQGNWVDHVAGTLLLVGDVAKGVVDGPDDYDSKPPGFVERVLIKILNRNIKDPNLRID